MHVEKCQSRNRVIKDYYQKYNCESLNIVESLPVAFHIVLRNQFVCLILHWPWTSFQNGSSKSETIHRQAL